MQAGTIALPARTQSLRLNETDRVHLAIMRAGIIASWRLLENQRSIDQAAVRLAITRVGTTAFSHDSGLCDLAGITRCARAFQLKFNNIQ